ncbi:MAG: hypothetical protein UR12_C0008G0027 [candidate division TM6 bacterium GW2011_GWF2_30_66]|nr:MAG: hypothetical protein UR12_C0008G0027 [candidate division TM6 bacterium GW2011_GWF2_30_66]
MKKILFLILTLIFTQQISCMKTSIGSPKKTINEFVIYIPEINLYDKYKKYQNKTKNILKNIDGHAPSIIGLFSPSNKIYERYIYKYNILIIFLYEDKELDIKNFVRKKIENEKNTSFKIIYIVEPNETKNYKEILDNNQKETIKKINIILENEAENNYNLNNLETFKHYDFDIFYNNSNEIKKEKLKNYHDKLIKIINLQEENNIDYYAELAKLTNNKALFRAIINSCYAIKYLKQIPVEHSGTQCNTLPDELASKIFSYLGAESFTGDKLIKKQTELIKILNKLKKILN